MAYEVCLNFFWPPMKLISLLCSWKLWGSGNSSWVTKDYHSFSLSFTLLSVPPFMVLELQSIFCWQTCISHMGRYSLSFQVLICSPPSCAYVTNECSLIYILLSFWFVGLKALTSFLEAKIQEETKLRSEENWYVVNATNRGIWDRIALIQWKDSESCSQIICGCYLLS